MSFSKGEQISEESMESPILPSPRSLFPELFRENLHHTKINVTSFKSQPLTILVNDNPDKPLTSQKHKSISIFGCCEVGCNCDANILGSSVSYSSSEVYSGSSSCGSSPTPSSPEGFSYLRQLQERKRNFDDCNSEPHYEPLSMKLQENNSDPRFARLSGFESQRSSTPDSTYTNFKRVFPIATGPLKPMPTTVRKPYQCTYCGKRFARPSSLKTHTYSHTGEKPYVCQEQGCHSQFSVLSNLRRHAKLHASIRGEDGEVMNNCS